MSTLYDHIDLLCKEHNIKPARLCRELCASKSVVTDLKAGRRSGLSAELAEEISSYFGISVRKLLTGYDRVKLSNDEQTEIYKLFENELKGTGMSFAFAVIRAGVKRDYSHRLQSCTLSLAPIDDILSTSLYIDWVKGEIGKSIDSPYPLSEKIIAVLPEQSDRDFYFRVLKNLAAKEIPMFAQEAQLAARAKKDAAVDKSGVDLNAASEEEFTTSENDIP